MSTWLALADESPVLSAENTDTPVLMCHGNADQVVSMLGMHQCSVCATSRASESTQLQVKYVYGQESFERLKAAGSPISFKTYRGLGHGVDPQEVQDITKFIVQHLPNL